MVSAEAFNEASALTIRYTLFTCIYAHYYDIIILIYDNFLKTMQKHNEVHNGKKIPYPTPLF